MNAPACALPAAENDSRPARPVVYQTRGSATAHATKAARRASRSGTATTVLGVADCYQPAEGGIAFRVTAEMVDYAVTQLAGAEYARLVQSGLRNAIAGCLDRAKALDLAAASMRAGSSTQRMLEARARAERDQARELERRLTVGVAA